MIQIVTTGHRFIGKGIRSFESVIEELINSARDEIHIAVYTIAPSAIHLVKLIENRANYGVRINILVNSLDDLEIRVKNGLIKLQKAFPGTVRVVNFKDIKRPEEGDFHAKILVADRRKALIGSANLSWGGTVTNYEIGILVEGGIAWQVAGLIDKFFQ